MDKSKRHRKYDVCYENEICTSIATSSTADKIRNIRQQLEELASAYNKRSRKTPKSTKYNTINNQFSSPSVSISESKEQLSKNNIFHKDNAVPADAELSAYNKFISSLTRIIRDNNQQTSESVSFSACLNTENISLGTPKRSLGEKGTFLIQKDVLREPRLCAYRNLNITGIKQAEKTTYCRPVACSEVGYRKALEQNLKIQLLVKKLAQARQKEKQNEAWNNYINELKHKHRYYDYETNNRLTILRREDEQTPNIIDDSYGVGYSWKQSNLCEHVLDDVERVTENMREVSNIKKHTWSVPPYSKAYKYANNSFCCPMSSQGRHLIMKKDKWCPGCSLRPQRFFRGSSIIVEKQLSRKKLNIIKSRSTTRPRVKADSFGNEAIQTVECGCSIGSYDDEDSEILNVKTKLERASNFAEKVKRKLKLSRDSRKHTSLDEIEQKLDTLIKDFNIFLDEIRQDKIIPNVKSEAVSCSSICNRHNALKIKNDTCSYNLLSKNNVTYEINQYKPQSSLFLSPRPISQDTIHEILQEERNKSEEAKKDIDNILNRNQCAVQITIDIPTKEHSTEVTNSFCNKTKEEGTIIEVTEPAEGEGLCKKKEERSRSIARLMTIAVNTDPMGLLALFRVSAETVKQILSYMPNLDYVTYLARRQLGNSITVARYVCNICSASFTRPSALNDHIQLHNVTKPRDCCVCRHVLDRHSQRSGLFECAHCGQMFTRAYCRELHQKTCSKARIKNGARPSLVMLT